MSVGFPPATREKLEKAFLPEQIKQDVVRHTDGWAPVYVEASAVIKRLNEAFDSAWSFHIVSYHVAGEQIIVHGRLVVGGVTKEQFGTCFMKRRRGELVDIGSDYKAAATDALKKCATQFGVALELYSKDESPMQGMGRTGDQPTEGSFPAQQANPNAPALSTQLDSVRKMFAGYGVGEATWVQQIGVSPEQLTQGQVMCLMSGQHPFVQHLISQSGRGVGLQKSNA